MVTVAKKIENTMQSVKGFCVHSSAIKDVDHKMLWLMLLNEVRLLGAHALNCSMTHCDESFIKEALVDRRHNTARLR